MKILVLILARGGSKRLPNKNKKLLGNLPLIQWTIDFAKKLNLTSIMLSTDDKDIYKIGKKNDIIVPWLRPKQLSTDTATSANAAIHSLNWYEKNYCRVNGLILLQPTSPFRNLIDIKRAINNFKKNKNPIIAIFENEKKSSKFIIKKKSGNFIKRINTNIRYQCKTYSPTGSFYMISPKDLRKNLSFYNQNTRPLIINETKYQIDIDTLKEFNYAKNFINDK